MFALVSCDPLLPPIPDSSIAMFALVTRDLLLPPIPDSSVRMFALPPPPTYTRQLNPHVRSNVP